MSEKPYMVVYDEPGYSQPAAMGESVDDFGATGVNLHIERMDDNNYWMGITFPDGRHLRWWIGHKNPRARVNAYFEEER